MKHIEIIKSDLEKGFKKTQLEKLIGLPENSLSGVLSGKKKLSRQSIIKIELWNKSEKPDPFTSGISGIHVIVAKEGKFKGPASLSDHPKCKKDTPAQEPKFEFKEFIAPKNLDQLKALCPKELTGFDRSEWIRNERLKYNI